MAVFDFLVRVAFAAVLAPGAMPAQAAQEPALRVVRKVLAEAPLSPPGAARPAHRLRVTLALMRGTGWEAEPVLEAAKRAVRIFEQCDIHADSIELAEFEGPDRYRTLFTPVSRKLVAELGLPKPTVFFLADTRHRPAFDAEAIGRGNSRTRPEMADTVWIVRGARDLDAVIAHELAHVLADSGEHSDEDGNLMREDSSPDATNLSSAQCDRIVKTGTANGLLQPPRP